MFFTINPTCNKMLCYLCWSTFNQGNWITRSIVGNSAELYLTQLWEHLGEHRSKKGIWRITEESLTSITAGNWAETCREIGGMGTSCMQLALPCKWGWCRSLWEVEGLVWLVPLQVWSKVSGVGAWAHYQFAELAIGKEQEEELVVRRTCLYLCKFLTSNIWRPVKPKGCCFCPTSHSASPLRPTIIQSEGFCEA